MSLFLGHAWSAERQWICLQHPNDSGEKSIYIHTYICKLYLYTYIEIQQIGQNINKYWIQMVDTHVYTI